MKRSFRTEPEASAELEEAAMWYADRQASLGAEFVEAFDAALEQIGRWPEIGHLVPRIPADVPARRFPLSRSPYHVVYVEWDGVIRVLAVAHDHRKPSYWFSRL